MPKLASVKFKCTVCGTDTEAYSLERYGVDEQRTVEAFITTIRSAMTGKCIQCEYDKALKEKNGLLVRA